MTNAEKVLLVAGAYVGLTEEPKDSNRGTLPKLALSMVGLDEGHAWCAGFTTLAGVRALGAAWPVPRSGRVQTVYEWAEKAGRIVASPVAGDLFVLWYPSLKRYGHIGFVASVLEGSVSTIEGNTGPDGSREGYGVFRKTRPITDRMKFIRWQTA